MAGFQRLWQPEIPIDAPTPPDYLPWDEVYEKTTATPKEVFDAAARRIRCARVSGRACAMDTGGAVQAQTFTLLHAFTGGADGGDPAGGLVMDGEGNLDATTT